MFLYPPSIPLIKASFPIFSSENVNFLNLIKNKKKVEKVEKQSQVKAHVNRLKTREIARYSFFSKNFYIFSIFFQFFQLFFGKKSIKKAVKI